jgi:hypothetical protein
MIAKCGAEELQDPMRCSRLSDCQGVQGLFFLEMNPLPGWETIPLATEGERGPPASRAGQALAFERLSRSVALPGSPRLSSLTGKKGVDS